MHGTARRTSRKSMAIVLVLAMLLALVPSFGILTSADTAGAEDEKVAWVDFSKGEAKNMVAQFGHFDDTEGLVTLDEYGQVGKNLDFIILSLDHNVIGSDERALTIEVTYLDVFEKDEMVAESQQRFEMEYNAEGSEYQKAGTITLTDSGEFKTANFYTIDAKLSYAQQAGGDKHVGEVNGQTKLGGDIRIGCIGLGSDGNGGWLNFPIYIQKIKVSVTQPVDDIDPPTFPAMTDLNNFEGKSVAGYQMWFTASKTSTGWVHWNGGTRPEAGRITVEMWPDISEYPDSVLQQTGFQDLGDGRKAQLFSSKKDETVDLHVSWMKEYGIDGFAIQRFYGETNVGRENGRVNLDMAKDAAEKYDRLFYIMYDLNGAQSAGMYALDRLQSDFVNNIEGRGLIESKAYAQMGGKPVVCMWGLDEESDSYATHDAALAFIKWLQERGYYVIGGVPNNEWFDESNSFSDVYQALDMISPWTVGRYSNKNVAGWMNTNVTKHIAYCEKYGIDYQPVILAGSAWSNFNTGYPNDNPRMAGEFMWKQATLLKDTYGASCVYFAMFDEYDEGTAIMKNAQDYFDIPTGFQYFQTNAVDGTWLSSDYYLRLAGTIVKMMRGEVEVTEEIPIPHSEGPVYFRNSFESRWSEVYEMQDDKRVKVDEAKTPIDPCATYPMDIYREGRDGSDWVMLDVAETVEDNEHEFVKTGDSYYEFAGTAYAGNPYINRYCQINETKILVPKGLTFEYSTRPQDDAGRYVFMDLVFDDGTLLSDIQGGIRGAKGTVGEWNRFVYVLDDSLVGKTITGIVVAYDHPVSADTDFDCLIDDVFLQVSEQDADLLKAVTETAEQLIADTVSSQYEADKLAAVEKAVADANKVLGSSGASAQDIVSAIGRVQTAVKGLMAVSAGIAKGDINADGSVNTTDARLALQFAVDKIELGDTQQALGDVNNDGKVDTTDARLILQFAVGKITSFN